MRNLADMDKTVNGGKNVGKCAEGCKAYYSCINNCTNRIIALHNLPRAVLNLLEAEGNLSCFLIECLDCYLNGIANLNNLAGMLDS